MRIAAHLPLGPKKWCIILSSGGFIVSEGPPIKPNLNKLFENWHCAWVDPRETDNINAYQNRQDHHEGQRVRTCMFLLNPGRLLARWLSKKAED